MGLPLFVFPPRFDFQPDAESVIVAIWVKAHVNNKLQSEVPSILVVTNQRLIIYRTESIRGYWIRLILATTLGKIPIVGFIVSWLTEKMVDGVWFVTRSILRTEKDKRELPQPTQNELINNHSQWKVTFEKDLLTLRDELKQVHIIDKPLTRFILLDTKSFWKSFRYPLVKFLVTDHFSLLNEEIKTQHEEISHWLSVTCKDQEVLLKPHS